MVKNFYGELGFTCIQENQDGSTKWLFTADKPYTNQNTVIDVNGGCYDES